jgi:hypothetical protein
MGPVNWLAVIMAVVAALAVQAVWYGPVLGARAGRSGAGWPWPAHRALAHAGDHRRPAAGQRHDDGPHVRPRRHGDAGRQALALFHDVGRAGGAFVIPGLWIGYTQQRISTRLAMIDGSCVLLCYLAMGLVFFLLG